MHSPALDCGTSPASALVSMQHAYMNWCLRFLPGAHMQGALHSASRGVLAILTSEGACNRRKVCVVCILGIQA